MSRPIYRVMVKLEIAWWEGDEAPTPEQATAADKPMKSIDILTPNLAKAMAIYEPLERKLAWNR